MSRLYYGMNSNLQPSDGEHTTPYIDYFAFDNKEKKLHISVSCNMDHDWGCGTDNVLSGRFKGLEVAITDYDDNEIHEYEEMTDEDFELLKDSVLYEVGMYFPNPSVYDDGFYPKVKNIDINIMNGDDEINFKSKTIDVISYGD